MIENLAIYNIPKTKKALEEILKILNDESWDEDYLNIWIKSKLDGIEYTIPSYSHFDNNYDKPNSHNKLISYEDFRNEFDIESEPEFRYPMWFKSKQAGQVIKFINLTEGYKIINSIGEYVNESIESAWVHHTDKNHWDQVDEPQTNQNIKPKVETIPEKEKAEMLKNLVITNIPKNEQALKQVLNYLGDDSWESKHFKEWLKNDNFTGIKYSKHNQSYCHYKEDDKLDSHIEGTYLYEEFIEEYENLDFKTWMECIKNGAIGKQAGNSKQELVSDDDNIYDRIYDIKFSPSNSNTTFNNGRALWVEWTDQESIREPSQEGLTATYKLKAKQTNQIKGKSMKTTIKTAALAVKAEVTGLINESGAADIAMGRVIYNNFSSAFGKTIVKIPLTHRFIGKFSKKMRLKNEAVQLASALLILIGIKQVYTNSLLSAVRGHIINRLYEMVIEATGMDDVVTIIQGVLNQGNTSSTDNHDQ